jgi:hypothetical protein
MGHEVFDTLNLIRELQAQYAASRAQQHFIPAPGMSCATTAWLAAIDLERCRWTSVSHDAITVFGGIDALTAPAGPHGLLHASAWPVSTAVRWSGRVRADAVLRRRGRLRPLGVGTLRTRTRRRALCPVLATVEAIPAMRRDGRSSPGRPCTGDPSP